MSLTDYLHKELVTCLPTQSIQGISKVMKEKNVGAVVVVEKQKPIGIITDRDLVVRCIAEDRVAENLVARDIMTSPVKTIHASGEIFEALSVMREYNVRRLPVVDNNGFVTSILTLSDVLSLLTNELSALTTISQYNGELHYSWKRAA